MTEQETFNLVVAHLRKQGRRSVKDGECCYRGLDDTKCAAGCLIPDDKYRPEFEGIAVMPGYATYDFSLSPRCRKIKDNCIALNTLFEAEGHDLQLLVELQRIHDGNPPDGWEAQFYKVATKYKLTLEAA